MQAYLQMDVNSEWKIKKKLVILRSTSALAIYRYRFNSEHLDFFPLTLSADSVAQKIITRLTRFENFLRGSVTNFYTIFFFLSHNVILFKSNLADNKEILWTLSQNY